MPPPRKPKGKSSKNGPPTSALDSEQRVLHERQRQLKDQIEALQRTIREANPPTYRMNAAAAAAAMPAQAPAGKRASGVRRLPKKVVLRAEKQEGRLQTLALLVVVVAVVLWALSRYF